ncbi:MAG: hypothetical protein COW73_06060 [Nitrospirae bacterium CG18_big_fil_WC_8_21_14_2_50_70_55]|nr:hypothetical protein [Deltaproteobacteria bacterium]OIP62372.1 MAG: hypothetical protein AUK30_10270 [Nitrospirae bacterium CG2_30_70_394]PIQ05340.1 MAG: hypothetical protein COW73_06060 [Nitrospirae bacterium CG18_big_fil_WC_8_21_14_2_50_70_55]PIU78819.1 MAG: hypothetical protein COS73_06210 [Nitrospirae bacterium CG06_land_8_20_14_3_00_70_43]PIW81803.1 MAG: hypothetical protein COZ96_11930 [Nitrospirae bacterium CG_4_8_14_3_um_filter_70_85]PIX83832.1 MAG: hypothetical protein COZ33_03340 
MADSHDFEPDGFLEGLANDLMQAIGRTLNQSDQVQEVMERIQTQGYRVAVVLAALTHVTAKGEGEGADTGEEAERQPAPPTPFDRLFLRQVGIKGELPS